MVSVSNQKSPVSPSSQTSPAGESHSSMARLASPARLHFAPNSPFGIVERLRPGTYARMMKSRSLKALREMLDDEGGAGKRDGTTGKAAKDHIGDREIPPEIQALADSVASGTGEDLARVDADLANDDNRSPEEALLEAMYSETVDPEVSGSEPLDRVDKGDQVIHPDEELQQLRSLLYSELRSSSHGRLTDALILKLTFDGFYRSGPYVVVERQRIPISQRALELFSRVNRAVDARGEDSGPDTCVFSQVPGPARPAWEVAFGSPVLSSTSGENGHLQTVVEDCGPNPDGQPEGGPSSGLDDDPAKVGPEGDGSPAGSPANIPEDLTVSKRTMTSEEAA